MVQQDWVTVWSRSCNMCYMKRFSHATLWPGHWLADDEPTWPSDLVVSGLTSSRWLWLSHSLPDLKWKKFPKSLCMSPSTGKKNKKCHYVIVHVSLQAYEDFYSFTLWSGSTVQTLQALVGVMQSEGLTVQCYGSPILTRWLTICCDPYIHSNYFQVKSSHISTINLCPAGDWQESCLHLSCLSAVGLIITTLQFESGEINKWVKYRQPNTFLCSSSTFHFICMCTSCIIICSKFLIRDFR